MKLKTLEDFLKEKGATDTSAMEAEELAGLYNEYNELTRSELEKAIKDGSEAVEEIKTQLAEIQGTQIKQLNSALKAQGLAIAKFERVEKTEKVSKPLSQQIKEALEAQVDKLKKLKDGSKSEVDSSKFDFETKAPATMTFGNVSGGNIPIEDRLEGFNTVPSRTIRLLDIVASRTTSSNVVSWVYQANKDGSAGQTAEGSAKNQIDFDIVVASESLKKSTAFIKVSTEMIDDIEWIVSEIQGELLRELLKVVEAQTYSGDNTGQNHNGIRTVASAFAAGTFAGTVDNANIVDVLTVAMNQIMIAEQPPANYIMMHPSDVTSLKLVKLSTTDKRYVDRLIQTGSQMELDGVPIVATTLVAVGTYLVGSFDLALSVSKGGIRFDIGLDGNDFTNNVRTILAEWRGLTIVKNNDRSAFVAGTFATDIAALETP